MRFVVLLVTVLSAGLSWQEVASGVEESSATSQPVADGRIHYRVKLLRMDWDVCCPHPGQVDLCYCGGEGNFEVLRRSDQGLASIGCLSEGMYASK